MTSINPTYYAANILNSGFVLEGIGFDMIPMDAVGIYSNSNDDPLVFRNSAAAVNLYDIVAKSSTRLEFVCQAPTTNHQANYLGAIVSKDRQSVYWVNNTRPLP